MRGLFSVRKTVGLILIALVLLIWPFKAVATENEKPIKHIILISMDGLNYEGYASFPKSNVRYLAIEGVSAPKSLAIRADTVEAGEATLLTGCLPIDHQYYTAYDQVETESLLDIFQKQKWEILVVDGSGGKLKAFSHGKKAYINAPADAPDSEVMNLALTAFQKQRPFFTYIYLNDCKEAQLKPDQQAYYDALKLTDDEVGRLITRLKELNLYEQTALVVTAARSSSKSDQVPIVIKAPGVSPYTAVEGVTVFDVAPTICTMVGLPKPYSSVGVTIWNAFLPKGPKEEMTLIQRRVKELGQERIQNWIRYYELEREKLRLVRQIQEIKDERERIFGYAGEREHIIGSLRQNLLYTRVGALVLMTVLIMGYFVEYRILKRRFTLFK